MDEAAPPTVGKGFALGDPALALICLMGLALAVGGGGVSAAFGNLAVQLLAIAVLAVHARSVGGFLRHGPRGLVWLVAASCLLPIIQLVPLPSTWWTGLPGRDLVAQSLDLAGGRGWFPLSVAPGRTLIAFLGTLAPAAIVAVGCGLPPERLITVQRVTVAMGVAVALFGTTHLIDDRWGDFYASQLAMPGVLVGTFADRNATALFLDACILLLIGLPAAPRTATGMALRYTGGAFLALCVVLTGSRTGMVLLAAPAVLFAWRLGSSLWTGNRSQSEPGRRWPWLAGGVLAITLMAVALASSGRVQTSLSRFDQNDGMRAEMREDARFVAGRYWPVGAGMGTFDEVFQIDESLEYVSPRRAGRAHMDYLELAIEAGLAGLLLAVSWLGWAIWQSWRATRRPDAWPARAAALVIAAIAAQSVLSFPLRNQAMLCVVALAAVLLVRSPVAGATRTEAKT